MSKILVTILFFSGIGTFICVAFPTIVVIGFFLILPGLILAVMPTIFLWTLAFSAVWFPLREVVGGWAAGAVAMLAVPIAFWLIADASHRISEARLAAAVRPDVTPAQRIAISGHVRIDVASLEREPFDPKSGIPPQAPRLARCDGLCAALLFAPGVESVTVNEHGYTAADEQAAIGAVPLKESARTFRRVPRDACAATLTPSESGALGNGIGSLTDLRALWALWNLRLSTTDCIVAVPTRTTHDFVIADGRYTLFGDRQYGLDWSLLPHAVTVQRVEIRRGDGTVLLRKLLATTQAITRPLWVGGSGGLENFRFGWNRASLSNKARYAETDGVGKVLLEHTGVPLTVDPADMARRSREHLQAMLRDPAVTAADPGWKLLENYFGGLRKGTPDATDRNLIVALIRDRRVTDLRGIWDAVRALGSDGTVLRAAMVDRLANPGADDARDVTRQLGRAVGTLPDGAFAVIAPEEIVLLADPDARRRAPGLVARQADRGTAALPMLLDIFEFHARAFAAKRNSKDGRRTIEDDSAMLGATQIAFCRLGPDAASALPRLEALDREGLFWRGLTDSRDWQLTLARIGKPVDSFAKPENLSGTEENFRRNLRNRLDRFDPTRDCRL
ncbi:hypothetical protein [Sphingomonas immobilis]|uniref:Uncharacterized protein n=1 Tax=Sphingomonas immobilis TaxID=3063997 RepID=A0ABT9A0D9_9SPHN|nr:hypothetical protein [Sphingomonas sp. CA1-15]MDO7842839.1 hypothetical protein [Sphingomonas sp. CA1-15]